MISILSIYLFFLKKTLLPNIASSNISISLSHLAGRDSQFFQA